MGNELQAIGLSPRVVEALTAAGLDTAEKLIAYEVDSSFATIPGIGDAGAKEIQTALDKLPAAGDPPTGGDDPPAAGDDPLGDDDDTTAQVGGDDAQAGELLDPEEPGITPGERGRRYRAKSRAELESELGESLPGENDKLTSRGIIVPRKTSFVRGDQTFSPKGEPGETVVAELALFGECDELYFASAIAAGSAYVLDESRIETGDKGERTTPAEYVVRLRSPAQVGNGKRGAGHIIARLLVPNYRIPPETIVGLLRTRAAVYVAKKK